MVFFVFSFIGCTNNKPSMSESCFATIDTCRIKDLLVSFSESDKDTVVGDNKLREYYSEDFQLLWVGNFGVDYSADSLLNVLASLNDFGFSGKLFLVDTLQSDLLTVRRLAFDAETDTVALLARLEYSLTKSFLRYATGMKYGFFNPYKVLNRKDIDKLEAAKGRQRYRQLFDIKTECPTDSFYKVAFNHISPDDIGDFLDGLHPQSDIYYSLKEMLKDTALTNEDKAKVVCNMERCRWQGANPDHNQKKYVVVNIPEFNLYAFDGDSVEFMKIGCGTTRNKTPLLVSNIKWMEVNPVWIIPKSIIENEVCAHIGDTAYFIRNRYSIIDKKSGDTIDAINVTKQMLKSGSYRIVQKEGPGNSLGRLVFRFPNNLSIYLHDTNSPGFFRNNRRTVSHGCVRVERPFDFAQYLLENPDEWLVDRIRISIDMKPETDRGKKYVKEHEDEGKEGYRLVKRVNVEPNIPIYIVYYTVYPDVEKLMQFYPDVYGYDKLILNYIKPFLDISV